MFAIGDKEWPGISKLVEEAGEVLQVIGKLMGARGEILHWDGSNLKDRLEEEIADVQAACYFVIERCRLDWNKINTRAIKKWSLFNKWHVTDNNMPPTGETG